MDITYFDTSAAFRTWLEQHHDSETELNVGFWKKGSNRKGVTYAEAVDEAICFGWIDGVTRRIDDNRFTVRFTPRKKHSIWSQVNIKKIEVLIAQEKMRAAGLKSFEERDPEKTNLYSFERENVALPAEKEKRFRANKEAWEFFEKQAPSYKKAALWWVISAKKPETQEKRLLSLIATSEQEQRLAQFVTPGRRKK